MVRVATSGQSVASFQHPIDARPADAERLGDIRSADVLRLHLAHAGHPHVEEELRGRGAILSKSRPTTDQHGRFATPRLTLSLRAIGPSLAPAHTRHTPPPLGPARPRSCRAGSISTTLPSSSPSAMTKQCSMSAWPLTLFPDDRERGCASHGCGVRATSPGPDAWTPVP